MATVASAGRRVEFERPRSSEADDIQQIVRGILTLQAQFAERAHGPLERGTHAKGICARAVFEVLDVRHVVRDTRLAARLARGLFAQPGTYPATVRFANASGRVRSDAVRDVRALSFAVEVPPGLVGPATTRLDFSANSAPIFPINDAHAFATLMRVLSAGGPLASLRTLWSLPLRDLLEIGRVGVLGALQTQQPVRPYQTLRYWSTVPFRHGGDEAIKYSAIPSPDNPVQPLSAGADCLRDELARHLRDDSRMSTWEIGLQLLDADVMTRWGRRRDPSFWVENAAVEWKEAQAAFHIVGRLTLVPLSELSDDAARAMYIDVTQHSTPDSAPIGSINRARWSAESSSREARATGIVELPAPVPLRPSFGRRLARGAFVAALLLLVAGFAVGRWYTGRANAYLPPLERMDEVRYQDQGWGNGADTPSRQLFYYTPQGASMHGIRYSWFVNIERPFRGGRFADPDHMRQLRFIVDPFPTRSNPDLLPVGFSRRYDDTLQDWVADITCAACHTGQLHVTRPGGRVTALRVDGGQSMNAFTDMAPGSFQVELAGAFATTLANPIKFNRFARRVLGPDSSWSARATLWGDVLSTFRDLIRASRGALSSHWYPTQEGFGRTDALARIANTVFGDHLDPANYRMGNGPVSYPYMWNIWKFDWVQYNASVSQPMARNVGEAVGTGATYHLVDRYGRPVPPAERYRTSIPIENLQRIESTIQTLEPPPWPEDLLGRIDTARVARGRQLFNEHCAGCHGPHVASTQTTRAVSPARGPSDPLWEIRWKSIDDIGTDRNAAVNFMKNRVDLTRTGLDAGEVQRLLREPLRQQKARQLELVSSLEREIAGKTGEGRPNYLAEDLAYAKKAVSGTEDEIARLDQIDLRSVSIGEGLTIVGTLIRNRYYEDRRYSVEARQCFDGFDTLDLPQAVPGYKPRPLKGVWATPPFLHNGSIPTVYALLSPREERPATFYVGTHEYNPRDLGYVTARPSARAGGFVLDTALPGNRNAGHAFRKGYVPFDESKPPETQYQGGVIGPELTRDERYAIIEYLKVGPDEPPTPAGRVPPDCFALLNDRPASTPASARVSEERPR
jgi:hypothetical protein